MAGEVSFTPTESDYVAANRTWLLRELRRPRRIMALSIVTLACAVLGGILATAGDGEISPTATVIVAGLVGAGAMAGIYIYSYALMPRRAGRLYRQQVTLQKPLHYGWSEEGITFRSANGAGSMAWADLHRWTDDRGMFLFFLNDQLFYFLPHRVLGPEQVADLRATATALGPPHF